MEPKWKNGEQRGKEKTGTTVKQENRKKKTRERLREQTRGERESLKNNPDEKWKRKENKCWQKENKYRERDIRGEKEDGIKHGGKLEEQTVK